MGISIELGPAQYNNTKVGWVNEPDGRGTLSILVSCLSSLFLSSWAVMHLNIPRQSSNTSRRLATYFYWCIYGIFGPELVIWTAWRQLLSAWALRNQLREEKLVGQDWTITHGFYTLMGGFVIDTDEPDSTKNLPFPRGYRRLSLTPKGLLLLAKCGHLPKMSEREILDKSKVDELGKLLACTQVTWMIVQVCSRLILHLPVTTLEVTAVSHVLCALVLYALWWHKPRKVDEPTIINGEKLKPLAAFMLMCSKTSEGHLLPGFQLKGETSEMAQLNLLPMNKPRAVHTGQLEPQYIFTRKHSSQSEKRPAHAPRYYSADESKPLNDEPTIYRSFSTPSSHALEQVTTHENLDAATLERWKLAELAIRTYEPVHDLIRKPRTERNRKYAIALSTYPEMPEKCKNRFRDEEPDSTEGDWLECDTQDFVTAFASNWPHDGLLRTASGLWIGTCLWLVSIAFGAMHIAAWHASFPTAVEATLWRSTSLYVAFSGLLWAAIHVLALYSARVWWSWYNIMSGDTSRWIKVAMGIVCGVCGLAYLFSRAYLIIESFISLRHLPVAAYVVPEWTLGVPHIA